MRAPLIPIVSGFILGIIIGNYVEIPDFCLWAALCAGLPLLLLYPVWKKRAPVLCCIYFSMVLLGILAINPYCHMVPGSTHVSRFCSDRLIGLEGLICENPNRSPDKTDLVLQATRIVQNGLGVPVYGKVLLSVYDVRDMPRSGDCIRVKLKLKRPRNFNNPGGFDYEGYLRLKGILVRSYIDSSSKMVIIRGNGNQPLSSRIEAFRDKVRILIRNHAPPEQGPILQAMVLGEQNEIPKDILAAFNRTGTTHILAISGFNVGIVFLISMFGIQHLLKSSEFLLLRFNSIKIATLLTAVPVILYAFIAGLGMSVIRAALMFLALIVAVVFGKERDLPNTLALAALAMLALYPPALFDVSFQLSFVAVAAILFIVPRFSGPLQSGWNTEPLQKPGVLRKALRLFSIFLLVTAAATLGTIPLTTYYFNTFSLIVVIGNILLIPVMGYAVTLLSMAIILAAPVSTVIAVTLIKISSILIQISVAIAGYLSSLPFASIYVATPTRIELAGYYLLLVTLVLSLDFYLKRHGPERSRNAMYWKWSCAASVLIMFFFAAESLYLKLQERRMDRLSVTFIDVGQGNSALVKLPGGATMLIDGGGSYDDRFDMGRNVIAPFLWKEKISTVDRVVLTHPHPDHLNGLIFILEHFSVREVWSNGSETMDESFLKFKGIIREKGMTHRVLNRPANFHSGPVFIQVLNPEARNSSVLEPDNLLNDSSLVLTLKYKKVGFLFPGDISSRVENRILKEHHDLRAQVLLAPHHGSRSSRNLSFLKKVRPDMVVFSCGSGNLFRLPSADVLEDCRSIGAAVFRTDLDGAIMIETDGEKIIKKSSSMRTKS